MRHATSVVHFLRWHLFIFAPHCHRIRCVADTLEHLPQRAVRVLPQDIDEESCLQTFMLVRRSSSSGASCESFHYDDIRRRLRVHVRQVVAAREARNRALAARRVLDPRQLRECGRSVRVGVGVFLVGRHERPGALGNAPAPPRVTRGRGPVRPVADNADDVTPRGDTRRNRRRRVVGLQRRGLGFQAGQREQARPTANDIMPEILTGALPTEEPRHEDAIAAVMGEVSSREPECQVSSTATRCAPAGRGATRAACRSLSTIFMSSPSNRTIHSSFPSSSLLERGLST
ncbi:hypothetical protein B0H17DRAFT_1085215 [Mycena rosella]|uniref:Secreted protein n=1 Tax=Mycena rosella TaxID=1033263 RepID=A0AAD7CZH6_MYCRO|nr:hypothetical protein B0H17DRAFT_1085215 [Mycena rosella]